MSALRRPWMVNRGVPFPESAAVPVALQPQPIWRCRAPLRVSDSVGDVLGVQRGEQTGSKEPGAPAPCGLVSWSMDTCVLWSIVVFICAHVGIHGGVHLRWSLVDHGGCHLRQYFAEHGGVVEQVISRHSPSAASPCQRSSSAVSVLPSSAECT